MTENRSRPLTVAILLVVMFAAGYATRAGLHRANAATPSACQHAAREASTVIAHNLTYKPLIDRLTAVYRARYSHEPLQIGDDLPVFDGRTPDLKACR